MGYLLIIIFFLAVLWIQESFKKDSEYMLKRMLKLKTSQIEILNKIIKNQSNIIKMSESGQKSRNELISDYKDVNKKQGEMIDKKNKEVKKLRTRIKELVEDDDVQKIR